LGSSSAKAMVTEQVAVVHRGAQRLHRHDRGVHRARHGDEPDQRHMRQRIARGGNHEQAERRVDPHDHHEVLRSHRRAFVPGPAARPDHREGADKAEHRPEGDQQNLQQAIGVHVTIPPDERGPERGVCPFGAPVNHPPIMPGDGLR
jgi:hypothetical protein